ncbi:hypothetical protein BGZ98_005748 [Dissophora globulifera]|nr:hypothetical protein BGZ98_005748 [Dissophora globulifera]
MSLYGDLPPPGASSDAANPTEQTKSSKDANTAGSSTVAKAALPAGWSSSVTRLKPMMNRKPAPPKPKLAARNIPAGFVSLPSPHSQVLTGTAVRSAAPLAPVAATTEVSVPVSATAPTADESRWLKERMAQVQRQDHESHTNLRKQTKRTPVKGHPGPISLDDDYDIARPNEYEELKLLFEHEQKLREEENQRFQQQGTRQTLSQQRSMTRSTKGQEYNSKLSKARSCQIKISLTFFKSSQETDAKPHSPARALSTSVIRRQCCRTGFII